MIDSSFVAENVRQLMANKKVSFVQLYVCIAGTENPGTDEAWNFSNWYDFVHLRGGAGSYQQDQDLYDYIQNWFPKADLDQIWVCKIQFKNSLGDLITIDVDC